MKTKAGLFFLFMAGFFSSCTKPPVVPLANFNNVIVNGNVKAVFSPGSSNAVTSTSGIMVTTAVVGNSLLVSGTGTANISINKADTITSNGNSTLASSGTFTLNRLVLACNGTNPFTINNLNMKDSLIVYMNGSGTTTLSGISPSLKVYANGSGTFSGFGLTSTSCFVALNGSGITEVYVSGVLIGIINGNGIVYYKGTLFPIIPAYKSGTGQFIKK